MSAIVEVPLNEDAIETGRNGTIYITSLEVRGYGIDRDEVFYIVGRSRKKGNIINGGFYGLTGEELDQLCKQWLDFRTAEITGEQHEHIP